MICCHHRGWHFNSADLWIVVIALQHIIILSHPPVVGTASNAVTRSSVRIALSILHFSLSVAASLEPIRTAPSLALSKFLSTSPTESFTTVRRSACCRSSFRRMSSAVSTASCRMRTSSSKDSENSSTSSISFSNSSNSCISVASPKLFISKLMKAFESKWTFCNCLFASSILSPRWAEVWLNNRQKWTSKSSYPQNSLGSRIRGTIDR